MSKWKTYKRVHLQDLPMEPGVYAIYQDKELVYIGQSEILRQRLARHERLTDLTPHLVTVKVRLCNRRSGEWLALEFKLIRRLRPRLNRNSITPPKDLGLKQPPPRKSRTEGNMPISLVVNRVMEMYDRGLGFAYIAAVLTKQGIEDATGDWWSKDSIATLVKKELTRRSFGSGRYDPKPEQKYAM